MKRLGCLVVTLGLLGFIAGLGLLVVLRLNPPEDWPPEPHVPRPTPEATATPEARRAPPARLPRHFERVETYDRYVMRYPFTDHDGRDHDVSCAIGKSAHARAVASFGYRNEDVYAQADAGLRQWLEAEAAARGVADHVALVVSDGGVTAEPRNLPDDYDQRARVLGKLAEFHAVAWPQVSGRWSALRDEAYRRSGVLLRRGRVAIDHGGIVLRSESALDDCARALGAAVRDDDPRRETGVALAFFQEIPYQLPPDEVDGRQTLGLWVPTEVLVGHHGDCDSKSLAFGAIWRRLGRPVLVIDLPKHVLVGVELPPGPGDKFVRLGNRYFVIGEVAGPAKRRLGQEGSTPVRGYFDYTLVEPEGRGTPVGRGRSRS